MQLLSTANTLEELRQDFLTLIHARRKAQYEAFVKATTKTQKAMFYHSVWLLDRVVEDLKNLKLIQVNEDQLTPGPIL